MVVVDGNQPLSWTWNIGNWPKKKAKQTSVSSKNWKNKQKTTTKYDKTNRKKNNNKKRKMFK